MGDHYKLQKNVPYDYGYNVGFKSTYVKIWESRYTNNPKMLNIYMYITRYAKFSKYQILAELTFALEIMVSPE